MQWYDCLIELDPIKKSLRTSFFQISKQLVQDAHKKEISEMAEKLKSEEETRKALQKVRYNIHTFDRGFKSVKC